ncbi:recombinase family protein [Parelusimicrobium proximum]|uniref:recombinase family protein n=1 Tax=Parelusimicrobium proximum TaxID=3228953 RepID=UPI003D1748AC
MEKAVLYLRVSSKGQEDGYSLDAQEKLGLEYAAKNKLEIVKIWKGSESAWGKKERQNFNQMLEYVKKHADVKHVIFDILDRMTRNDFDKIKIKNLINDYGKTIHFSRTNKIYSIHSSSDDEFMIDIEVAVAKKMSNDISRKVKMGLTEKAEQGFYPSIAPTGYINVEKDGISQLQLDSVNAPLVKELFEKVSSGDYSLLMLEDILYAKGLRNPHRNNKVRKSTLHRMVHNKIYYGVFEWKGKLYANAKHTPIVSKELWDNAQKALRSFHRPHISKKEFAYRGLLTCQHCDCTVVGQIAKKKHTYYRCSFSKGTHEHGGYIREQDMPALFAPAIKAVSLPSEFAAWLENGVREVAQQQEQIKKNKKELVQREYSHAQKKLNNLYDLQLDGMGNKDMFRLKEREISEDLAHLQSELAGLEVDTQEICDRAHNTLQIATNLEALYNIADHTEKAHILRLLGTSYMLDGKNTVTPNYKGAFELLAKAKQIATLSTALTTAQKKKSYTVLNDTALSSKHLKWRSRRDLNPRSLP